MKFFKITGDQIEQALAKIQSKFENNLCVSVKPKPRYLNVRLKVKDNQGPGARHTYSMTALSFACWHATGYFLDAVFEVCPTARICTQGKNYNKNTWYWNDWNAGSQMSPVYMSDLCVCDR